MALRTVGLAGFVICVLGAPVADAREGAALVRFGTTGFGLDAATPLDDHVAVRLGGALFGLGTTQEESDVRYDADLKLRSLGGFFDFHPTTGPFRLTGGLVYNKNRVEATAVPTSGTFEIGGITYSASEVGTLKAVGRIGTRTLAPYLGLGVGSARGKRRAFFVFDFGVVFQGSPEIELSATGPLASDPEFLADLQAETADANEDLEPYKYYPVLSLGVGFRF